MIQIEISSKNMHIKVSSKNNNNKAKGEIYKSFKLKFMNCPVKTFNHIILYIFYIINNVYLLKYIFHL